MLTFEQWFAEYRLRGEAKIVALARASTAADVAIGTLRKALAGHALSERCAVKLEKLTGNTVAIEVLS